MYKSKPRTIGCFVASKKKKSKRESCEGTQHRRNVGRIKSKADTPVMILSANLSNNTRARVIILYSNCCFFFFFTSRPANIYHPAPADARVTRACTAIRGRENLAEFYNRVICKFGTNEPSSPEPSKTSKVRIRRRAASSGGGVAATSL